MENEPLKPAPPVIKFPQKAITVDSGSQSVK